MVAPAPFDPYALLAALERRRVTYIVIGAFARIIRGADELTDGLDIVPSLREENLDRLEEALADLGAERADKRALALEEAIVAEPMTRLRSPQGELGVVPEPAGTRRGYDDLRRAATREHLGRGLRPAVASTADLARMLAALGRETDLPRLQAIRHLVELEHSLDTSSTSEPPTSSAHQHDQAPPFPSASSEGAIVPYSYKAG